MGTHPEKRKQVTPKLNIQNRFKGIRRAVRVLSSALILGAIVFVVPRVLPAQHSSAKSFPAKERMYCYQKVVEPGATGGGLVRVKGFTVEVKPIQDPEDIDDRACRATIRSAKGETVFEHNDWGMEIDPITGKDVNGDGDADAVPVSFSGGAHCCWTYYIVSLGKNPGLIAKFENRSTASFKDLNGDGKVEILIRDGSFDDGFRLNHAFSPFPLLIVRLRRTKFEDVGSKFWPVYEKEIRKERSKVKDKSLREFRRSNPNEFHDSLAYRETEYSVLAIVLDYLYSGRAVEARRVLSELWPAKFQQETWEQMLDGYCSGLRAELELTVNSACKIQ